MKFCYYGHACFLLDTGKEKLLFDPFLTDNPQASIKADDAACDYILLSHAHSDHFADAPAIAERTGAEVIAIPEVIALFPETVTHFHPMNIGGGWNFPFGRVTMVRAFHSCGAPGGAPAGFVISFKEGPTVYYAGDTSLFSDMALIGKKFNIDYAILPIGDNFTMGLEDAVQAAVLLKARHVIPVHYNTWPLIEQDPAQFQMFAAEEGIPVDIVKPGEELVLKTEK